MRVAPERAQHDRRQAHHRADRKIDAAGDDDRRQHQREQPDLDRQPRDLECVGGGQKVVAGHAEDGALEAQHEQQHPLVVREEPLAPAARSVRERRARAVAAIGLGVCHRSSPAVRAPRPRPARARMIAALNRLLPERIDSREGQRRCRSCPSSATPISVRAACRGRRVIAVPPTTTAAIAFSSRPMPELPGIDEKRTAFSSAASPSARPSARTPPKTTRLGSMPASRAASRRTRRHRPRGPPRGCAEHQAKRHEHDERDDDDQPLPGSPGRARTTGSSRGRSCTHAPSVVQRKRVAPGDQHRQRDDDRRQPEARRPASRSARPAPRRAPARSASSSGIGTPVLASSPAHDAHDRELRADRDVDLADQDHQRHPDRDQQHRRVVQRQVAQVVGAEERRRDDGDERPAAAPPARAAAAELALCSGRSSSEPRGPSPSRVAVPSASARIPSVRRLGAVEHAGDRPAAHDARCGRSSRASRAARTRSSGSPRPARPGPPSARGSPPWRRRRRPASARRGSARTASSPASG